jgi:hypothetical protein
VYCYSQCQNPMNLSQYHVLSWLFVKTSLISIAMSHLSAPLVRLLSPPFPTKYNTRLTTKLNGHFRLGDTMGSNVVCLMDGSRFVGSSELVLLRAAHPSFSSWLSEVSPSISSTCGFGFTLANFIKLCSKRTSKSLHWLSTVELKNDGQTVLRPFM